MDRPCGSRTSLYDTKQLDVVLEGMARQAAVLLAGRSLVAVIGILRRGAPLADRLTEKMIKRFGVLPPLRSICCWRPRWARPQSCWASIWAS